MRNGDKDATFALPTKPGQTAEETKDGKGDEHFSKEPNPFENAFGAPSDTPGKTQLPGVTSLTSPAPLLGGMTPGWAGSLRSGPLSPAMLTGPTNNDYFNHDSNFAGSFPTPNESSLRTGLTPGGAGMSFPQPSPSSQVIFNAMQNSGATPGTLDFHRTAMHARANNGTATTSAATSDAANGSSGTTAGPDKNIQPGLDNTNGSFMSSAQRESLEQHDTDAANGLFMLAQARGNKSEQPQYPAPGQQAPVMPYMANGQDESKRSVKNSIASNMSGDTVDDEEGAVDGAGPDSAQKSGRKGASKKRAAGSAGKTNNARRKAEDTPVKVNAKKQKANSGSAVATAAMSMEDYGDESEEEPEKTHHPDGRKLTDEEKRKNFLERNRIAALKCRQRKKQWLANLQQKVELFSTENDALAATVTSLREEVVTLKSLLLAHKDCPVAHAQGISGMAMQNIAGDPQQYGGHPYAMAMGQGMHQHGMNQNNMQRR